MHLSRGRLALLCLIVVFSALCFSSPRADDNAKPGEKPAAKPDEKPTAKPDDTPLTSQEALKRITLPEGFPLTLFAGEPDLVQPIAMTIRRTRPAVGRRVPLAIPNGTDGRARPGPHPRRHRRRRQVDKRTVFLDDGQPLGHRVGFGGVWLCSCRT